MQTKICIGCKTEKPLKYFFILRGGGWVQIAKCRPCRNENRKYKRFWKNKDSETLEKNRMTRRANLLNCPVIIPFTKREIISRDGLNCYLCGILLTFQTATIDHVMPLSKGGFHCPNNAKIACLKCNQQKSNKYEVNND